MCIGYPGRVLDVDALGATVDFEGHRRRASILLVPDVAPGDWVLVAAGSIVDRLDPQEAQYIRATLVEAFALEAAETAETPVPAGKGGSR